MNPYRKESPAPPSAPKRKLSAFSSLPFALLVVLVLVSVATLLFYQVGALTYDSTAPSTDMQSGSGFGTNVVRGIFFVAVSVGAILILVAGVFGLIQATFKVQSEFAKHTLRKLTHEDLLDMDLSDLKRLNNRVGGDEVLERLILDREDRRLTGVRTLPVAKGSVA